MRTAASEITAAGYQTSCFHHQPRLVRSLSLFLSYFDIYHRTYTTAFDFLESYLDCLESSGAVQVWPPTVAFAKDMLSQATSHRFALLPTWKCFNTLSEKIAQTSALEDRRMRRDLQVIAYCSKSCVFAEPYTGYSFETGRRDYSSCQQRRHSSSQGFFSDRCLDRQPFRHERDS